MSTPYDELLDESRELERRARKVQGEFKLESSEEEIDQLVSDYHGWLARAVQLLPDEFRERFRFEYEGNFFQSRIKHFLEAPAAQSPIYSEVSQAGFHGDSETRILSWGMEILPSHATTEEVPR